MNNTVYVVLGGTSRRAQKDDLRLYYSVKIEG